MTPPTVLGPLAPTYHPSPVVVTLFKHVRVPCGFPSPARDYEESSLDVNSFLIRNRAATFFFLVCGKSMEGIGIYDGDYVAVDRSIPPQHGHIVLAVVNQQYTIKRLHRTNGVVELHAEHPDYPPICFKEDDELVIWGVVTGVIRKLPV